MEELDPTTEFAEAVTPETTATPAPAPTPGPDLSALQAKMDALVQHNQELAGKTEVLDRLRDVLSPGAKHDPRDAYVRAELERLAPELGSVKQIAQVLPHILKALDMTAEERIAEKTSSATDVMKGLMKTAGLDSSNPKTVGYMEEALVRDINQDPELKAMWNRGQVADAVKKAFGNVEGALLTPVRTGTKRSAVQTILEAPKATPRGGAPSPAPGAANVVDLRDTSRDGVRKAHDAAFARFQELLGDDA